MALKRHRSPDEYVSNNLTVRAWEALAQIQAEARKAGINPSKSAVLIATKALADAHIDELVVRLKEAQ